MLWHLRAALRIDPAWSRRGELSVARPPRAGVQESAVATSALIASNGRFTRAAGLILAPDQGRLRGLLGNRLWADPTSAPAMPVTTAKAFASPLRLRNQLL